jgi:hypothetical protein
VKLDEKSKILSVSADKHIKTWDLDNLDNPLISSHLAH